MSFWAQKLGAPAAPQQQRPPVHTQPTQPQQGPWWEGPQPQQPQQPVPQAAPPQPEGEYRPAKAQSLRSSATCPDCGSGNYFRPHGSPNAMEQCYECGFNARFAHSTAGAGLPGGADAGPATPARQIEGAGLGGRSQYNPQNIIASIK